MKELAPGVVIADRFELIDVIGRGGMGAVWRARDRTSGEPVALKVIVDATTPVALARFRRETDLLAGIRHPNVVRLVASGSLPDGAPFLAMEWLEGCDLARKLEDGPLSIIEALELLRQISDGLAATHAAGVVHRDVKPANLLLVDGAIARVKLVDFGVARLLGGATAITQTGVAVGTPVYMAPEQVRGDPGADERVDVFALGVVLYECLAGRLPLTADNVIALLFKILVESPPPLRRWRPDIPSDFEALLERMLAKDPAARPASGAELAALSRKLDGLGRPHSLAPPPPSLTPGERRFVSVVVAVAPRRPVLPSSADPLANTVAAMSSPVTSELREMMESLGARLENLADGSLVGILEGGANAADRVARGARLALWLRDSFPGTMAMASGRAVLAGPLPVGDVIERAVAIAAAGPAVPVDELTASLVGSSFELAGGRGAPRVLVRELPYAESPRILLGKTSVFVGREREMALLSSAFDECVRESRATAMVITGPPGIGKSRLADELRGSLARRPGALDVWMVRADAMRSGAPLGLLAELVRRAAAIAQGEPLDVRREKLRALAAAYLPVTEAPRVAKFLAELAGAPFDDDDAELAVARADPRLLGDRMVQAVQDFVSAASEARPVAIVIEDIHWADAITVRELDRMLAQLTERRLFILALGRPELSETFPRLWADRGATEIHLAGLSRRAAESLLQHALGEELDSAQRAVLIARAGGNAFFLEELARAASAGSFDDLPETLLAVTDARLGVLDASSRRLLRAASVFGDTFWKGGVVELLGGETCEEPVDAILSALVTRELVVECAGTRFAGERELAFRHALVREAAHGMLTDDDRRLGHALAGAWLERVGEPEPVVIAEHFELGGEGERASRFFARAAEQALGTNDLDRSVAYAARGRACGASGEELGVLHLIESKAQAWRGLPAEAAEHAKKALALFAPGTEIWHDTLAKLAQVTTQLGRVEELHALGEALVASTAAPGQEVSRRIAAARLGTYLLSASRFSPLANALLDEAEALASRVDDLAASAALAEARAWRALVGGDVSGYIEALEAVIATWERAGNRRGVVHNRINRGFALADLGAYAEAEKELEAALALATQMRLESMIALAEEDLAFARCGLGKLAEAAQLARSAMGALRAQGNRRHEAATHVYLSEILLLQADPDAAWVEAHAAASLAEGMPALLAHALASEARALLAQGRAADARRLAERAVSLLETIGDSYTGEAVVRLAWAEALEATRDPALAGAVTIARDRLLERARKITRAAWKSAFMESVPAHRATFELARRVLGTAQS